MNNRLKELRSNLDLNQEEFADRVNISRSHVASLERGSRNLTERTLADICREFGVSEDWIRTGKEPMFIQKDSTIITKLSKEYNLDHMDIAIVKSYLELNAEQRKTIKKYVNSIAKSITYEDEEVTVSKDEGTSIDKELESYRLELEAEKKGITSSVSESGEDIG